jgi:RNA polymerase sigma-70 factor, ECF subfamily
VTEAADDAELLTRSADGDRAAFTALMERHGGAVHRFLLSLGAAPQDAEDALQECFVSAWRSAESFQGAGSARSWLFTIARNTHLRQARRRAGEPVTMEPLEVLGAEAGWGATSGFDHRFEVAEEVRWALHQIPEDEREVVVLRDLEGLSGDDTAQLLELSLPAMKSRLHRGRLRLMAVMRGEVEHA